MTLICRWLFVAAAWVVGLGAACAQTVPTVVMTFDNYATTYTNAFFDMQTKGIPGTFFVDADHIGSPGHPIRDNLVLMAGGGWEIGARVYGTIAGNEANMVAVWDNNRDVALDRLKAQKVALSALGFDIKSIAAAQRAWSPKLRGLASHLFENVRVVDNETTPPTWQSYPIQDRLYVRDGATASLKSTDTAVSLCAQLDDLIADAVTSGSGKVWFVLVHKVSDPASLDPLYTVPVAEFQGFTSCLQNRIGLGKVRAVTFRSAMTPP